ncbi:MAG: hypothetical protein KA144_12290 [Xanthomonadaceae bacterium]|nr:hypothetical protein [Xanthomonadaceae bacterium]
MRRLGFGRCASLGFDSARVKRTFTMSDKPTYTYENLYSGSGNKDQPKMSDIRQDDLGDCYFVAVAGAMAKSQPDRIKDAITYNPETGNFNVTLYKDVGGKAEKVTVEVTQDDIKDNINRNGGSTLDNNGGKTPVWPAVLESAFAKMNDSDPKVAGLDEGYNKIGNGAWARDGMFALTGEKGTDISRDQANSLGESKVFDQVSQAIKDGRPVTLSTDPESGTKQDGLVDNHVYMVNKVYKDKDGEMMVELRNPWGQNQNVGEGKDTNSATITVKFKDVLSTAGFEEFNIGPEAKAKGVDKDAPAAQAPAAQAPATQAPAAQAPATQAGTGDKYLDDLIAKIGNPAQLRESLATLSANSPEFRREGAAQFQQQQTERAPAAPEAVVEERGAASRNR